MKTVSLNILDNLIQAFDDWTVTHAPEFSDESAVEAAEARIAEASGVSFYTKKLIQDIKRLVSLEAGTLTSEESFSLSQVVMALGDWTATFKGTPCQKATQDAAETRIMYSGGTLAYICHHREILETIRDRLTETEGAK